MPNKRDIKLGDIIKICKIVNLDIIGSIRLKEINDFAVVIEYSIKDKCKMFSIDKKIFDGDYKASIYALVNEFERMFVKGKYQIRES